MTKWDLECHIRIHSDERPYKCSICDAAYAQPSPLSVHMKIHSDERNYKCEECEATFKIKSSLTRHALVHTGGQVFKCSLCDHKATFAANLKVHMYTHMAESPFNCDECDWRFNNSQSLKEYNFFYHTEEGQKTRKREEVRIEKALTAAGIEFKREHYVTLRCIGGTNARTDFLIIKDGGIIVLEVDEDQHSSYPIECDVGRMCKIFESWLVEGNTLPVKFIRYSPHAFKVDGKTKTTYKKDREARLVKEIQETEFEGSEYMQVQYMYYDSENNRNVIWDDEAFVQSGLEECCLPPVV